MGIQRHHHRAEIVKRCECGARYDIRAWKGLRFMGLQDMEDGDLFLELRDCAWCESTISLAVHVAFEAEGWTSPSLPLVPGPDLERAAYFRVPFGGPSSRSGGAGEGFHEVDLAHPLVDGA